jgi:hypothetical protein
VRSNMTHTDTLVHPRMHIYTAASAASCCFCYDAIHIYVCVYTTYIL